MAFAFERSRSEFAETVEAIKAAHLRRGRSYERRRTPDNLLASSELPRYEAKYDFARSSNATIDNIRELGNLRIDMLLKEAALGCRSRRRYFDSE